MDETEINSRHFLFIREVNLPFLINRNKRRKAHYFEKLQ